ncbi:MAG: PrsW family intramembrane metalloprotease [Bacillota bacterium]
MWVWYFYKKDKFDPEPKYLIVRDFFWGMIIVFPASILESPFSDWLSPSVSLLTLFFSTLFIVGLIEEGAKSLVIYLLHFNNEEFNEPIDGIIYGVTVGLGFAAFENLFYTVIYGYRVGLTRAVLTSLAHAAFSGIFGYYLGQAKLEDRKNFILYGFGLAVFLHGFYDFLVMGQLIDMSLTVGIIILLQIYLAGLIRKTTLESPFRT